MREQEFEDPLLMAVHKARPAIDDAALSPASADALRVLERVLHGEGSALWPTVDSPRGQHRLGARPRAAIRRILRLRIGAIATAAAAAVAAAVIVLSGISGAPSLVDRAYAAINAGYEVMHEVDVQTYSSPRGFYNRLEGWLRPADGRTRAIQVSGYRRARYVTIIEWIINANGDVFTRACPGNCRSDRISSFIEGRSRWVSEGRVAPGTGFGLTPGTLPGEFARWFRSAYRSHAIVDAGTAMFDGRRAARLQSMTPTVGPRIVFWRPGTPPPLSARQHRIAGAPYTLVDWYVDPATAQPVGFTASPCAGEAIHSCRRPAYTTRIVTFQRLDPTSQNLALLTGRNAPPRAR
jgi:hypothetical protein